MVSSKTICGANYNSKRPHSSHYPLPLWERIKEGVIINVFNSPSPLPPIKGEGNLGVSFRSLLVYWLLFFEIIFCLSVTLLPPGPLRQ